MGKLDRSWLKQAWPLRAVACCALCLSATAVPSTAAGGLQDSAWPMFHENAGHTARTFDPIPAQPHLAWRAPLSDSVVYSSPALASDGTSYLGDLGKDLWAFDPSGAPKWSFHTSGNIRRSSPAVGADGTVYFGSADGNLYAVDPAGGLRWATPIGAAVKTSPAIAGDGTIYVGADDGNLWAINPDGTKKWSFATGDTVRSSPAILGDSLIVFGSNDGGIYAVRPDSSLAWVGYTGGPVKASPAIGQGNHVIVGSYDGFLYSIRSNGSLSWAEFTNETIRSSAAIGLTGKIYLGVDTELQCYHDDGRLSYAYPTGQPIFSSPAVHTDPTDSTETVIFGSDDSTLYAVSLGNLVWSYSVGSAVRSSPAIGSDGRIYFGASDGGLYVLDNASATGVPLGGTVEAPRALLYPNPAKVGQTVSFRLLSGAAVEGGDEGAQQGAVTIYDVLGRRLRTLAFEGSRPALWDGTDENGGVLPAGVYLYRWSFQSGEGSGAIVRIR
jgi:outer membrane protein assembly factor BamB